MVIRFHKSNYFAKFLSKLNLFVIRFNKSNYFAKFDQSDYAQRSEKRDKSIKKINCNSPIGSHEHIVLHKFLNMNYRIIK